MQATWPKRRHGALQPLSENSWRVEGPVPGMLYRRQMIVARDDRGRLLLHSAIALDAPGMVALEALGTPTWLVVPNGQHRLDAPAYKQRYPELVVVTPRGAAKRVRRVVPVDLAYDELPALPAFRLEQAPWPGAQEGVVHVQSRDGVTLVFNDLLWTPPDRGVAGVMQRWLRQGPEVPWLARQMLARDRGALRDWLMGLCRVERLVRVVPGHGPPILQDARAALERVALAL
jgi:hypothetical protein